RPPRSTLLPYTTLFRSLGVVEIDVALGEEAGRLDEAVHREARVLLHPAHRQQQLVAVGLRVPLHEVPEHRVRAPRPLPVVVARRSEEHTSELQSPYDLV